MVGRDYISGFAGIMQGDLDAKEIVRMLKMPLVGRNPEVGAQADCGHVKCGKRHFQDKIPRFKNKYSVLW